MKKRIMAIMLCLCMSIYILSAVVLASNEVNVVTSSKNSEAFTTTKISTYADFSITSVSADCALSIGEELELTVSASDMVSTYSWEVSADSGTSWTTLPSTTDKYTITNAVQNTPANVPYQYRVTVTNDLADTDSKVIRVLVSNDYDYRKITLRNGDIAVSAYMHKQTRLVTKPLSPNDAERISLESELTNGCLPILSCDISLINQNKELSPYYGKVFLEFDVGSEFNTSTLKVFHLYENDIQTHSGTVSDGILPITVNTLSSFMIEADVATNFIRTINSSASTGGSISPLGNVHVVDGVDKKFVFMPDPGYVIDTVMVNAEPVTFSGNSYTVQNITADMSLNVTFRKITPSATLHSVTVTSGARGSISPSGTLQVLHGMPQTFFFSPEDNYELDELTINGVSVEVLGDGFTLSAVEGDTNIHATFRSATTQLPDIPLIIASNAGANGSISPMGDIKVGHNGEVYFYFIPDEGYEVDEVSIDGIKTSVSDNNYFFDNVDDDHLINVTFKKYVPPTVTSVEITPAMASVNRGDTQQFSAVVTGSGNPTQTVTWSLKGAKASTSIDENGKLTVASDETSDTLTVKATSTVDETKSCTATVKIPTYTVTLTGGNGYTLSPASGSAGPVFKGEKYSFSLTLDQNYEKGPNFVVKVNGTAILPINDVYTIESIAAMQTVTVEGIVLKGADYSKVDAAIAKIPTDLSLYTDDTVKVLNDAKAGVIRGRSITQQAIVDDYAVAIEKAIAGLIQKVASTTGTEATPVPSEKSTPDPEKKDTTVSKQKKTNHTNNDTINDVAKNDVSENSNTNVPTGDSNHFSIWILLFVIAGSSAIIFVMLALQKKRKE